MNLKEKIEGFTKEWEDFVEALKPEEIANTHNMQLIVNYTQFVYNRLQSKVLLSATRAYKAKLKEFNPNEKPKLNLMKKED